MSHAEETVGELTERVAGMVETVLAGGHVNATELRTAVLEVCQLAQGGAGVRAVPCHLHTAAWLKDTLPDGATSLWPVYGPEGVALRLDYQIPPLQRGHPQEIGLLNLGSEGGLVLAHELQATAALQAGLAARQRAN